MTDGLWVCVHCLSDVFGHFKSACAHSLAWFHVIKSFLWFHNAFDLFHTFICTM